MKDTIFISHATPDDNVFATWLATKLELFGYKVWVDVNDLDPSVDFWDTINKTIREEAIKFVFITSKSSCDPNRDGVKKELAVADKMRKVNPNFIVPVRVDDVSYSDLPVEILRLNVIDFSNDWADGLNELVKYLRKEAVPLVNNTQSSQFYIDRWNSSQSAFRSVLTDDFNEYCSNLFPVELPERVYIYHANEVEDILNERHIPLKKNKSVVITFACNNCMSSWAGRDLDCITLNTTESIEKCLEPQSYLGETIDNLSRDIISLVNWSVGEYFYSKGLRKYKTSNQRTSRNVYYFTHGEKFKRANTKRAKVLSGKYKTTKHWHFGVSAFYVQYPAPGIIVKWHLVFSDDNYKLLPDSSQISARRSKGRLMFNKEWKELLQTAMSFCSQGADYGCYSSCCEENALYIASNAYSFISDKSYVEPYVYKTVNEEFVDE